MREKLSQEKNFLNSIATDKDLQKKYKREHKLRESTLKRKHRIERVNLRKNLQDEIADRETHDEITNMSIFPFIQIPDFTVKLGYRLRACDPLQELKQVPNFDFLVVNYGNSRITAVFGDIKTSTVHPNRIIDDILRKKEAVEKNEDYIRKTYLNNSKLPIKFEYVVVVHAFFSNEIRNAIEQKGGKIIIWQADRHAHKIGLANPGENNHINRLCFMMKVR